MSLHYLATARPEVRRFPRRGGAYRSLRPPRSAGDTTATGPVASWRGHGFRTSAPPVLRSAGPLADLVAGAQNDVVAGGQRAETSMRSRLQLRAARQPIRPFSRTRITSCARC